MTTHVREAGGSAVAAAAFFERQLNAFAAANPPIEEMVARFRAVAGVNLATLIDHWTLPGEADRAELTGLGLVETTLPEGDRVWRHPNARLPRLRYKVGIAQPRLALVVEDIPLFAAANGLTVDACHGDPGSRYQCGHVSLPNGELMPITRNGYHGFAPGRLTASEAAKIESARAAFRSRDRSGEEAAVLESTQRLVEDAIAEIGRDRATDEFFRTEREFYMTRNQAARWQYEQQQKIGIGWANQDHHTYRCSRQSFRGMLHLWQTLGFVFRERFYAGAEAGWGAQVLEHPVSRVVLFTDVDMAPEEREIDFSNTDLPPRDTLGTIGLWCALHGSSIAEAGMHHLECEFDFVRVQANLEAASFPVMAPFTDLPMLRQAFTAAEIWPVAPERLGALLKRGSITSEQAEKFRTAGAAGSHLEILQRWDGYKGFNQTGVSHIIRQTDARNR